MSVLANIVTGSLLLLALVSIKQALDARDAFRNSPLWNVTAPLIVGLAFAFFLGLAGKFS